MGKAEVEKPVVLGIIEGGKQDPIEPKLAYQGPKDEDWLRELGYGARFLSRRKNLAGPYYDNFGVAFCMDEAFLLINFDVVPGAGMPQGRWVDTKEFSSMNRFVALLPEEPDKEAGKNEHHLPRPTDS